VHGAVGRHPNADAYVIATGLRLAGGPFGATHWRFGMWTTEIRSRHWSATYGRPLRPSAAASRRTVAREREPEQLAAALCISQSIKRCGKPIGLHGPTTTASGRLGGSTTSTAILRIMRLQIYANAACRKISGMRKDGQTIRLVTRVSVAAIIGNIKISHGPL